MRWTNCARGVRINRYPSAQVTTNKQFSDRLFDARLRLEGVLRRKVSDPEFAGMVARRLGGEPVAPSTVWRWGRGAAPDLPTLVAIAAVLQVDPGWLAFGEDSAAPGPDQVRRPPERPDAGVPTGSGGGGPEPLVEKMIRPAQGAPARPKKPKKRRN